MLNYCLIFGVALLGAFLLTPLFKIIAIKLNILDKPGFRKIHTRPIPVIGGVAVFLAFLTAIILTTKLTADLFYVLAFSSVFVAFGLIDDVGWKTRARYKIWAHLLFALAFIFLSGISFTFFRHEWLNILLTVGFITFMTNSLNMLDGMDGLVSGLTFIAAGAFAILALKSGQNDLIMIAITLMGAVVGFLRYNFNPASIFLGESGATFIGFILAILAVRLQLYGLWDVALSLNFERVQLIAFIIPLIILGIPIFDTYFVFINRFLHNVKFSQPGKDHSHHRIHLMGFSQKETVFTIYAIQVILVAIALAMVNSDAQQFFALLAIVAIFFIGFTLFLSRVEVYSNL